MAILTESEFTEKAEELFNELEGRVKNLEIVDPFVKQIRELISEAKELFGTQEVKESLEKYLEARASLDKAETSIWAEPLAKRLFLLEIFYLFVLLLVGYLTYRWPDLGLWRGLVTLDTQCTWFGALGGVAIGLYGIYSHLTSRDFDPKFRLWYISKPFIGGIFGWFAYLVYYIGLVSVQGIRADVHTPEVAFIIAFLAGFNERFTVRIIDRLLMILTTWEEKKGEAPGKKEEKKTGKRPGK